LVEPPTLLLNPEMGYNGMIQAFVEASPEARKEALDMYCPCIVPDDDAENEDSSFSSTPSKAEQTKQRLKMLEEEYDRFQRDVPIVKNLLPLENAKKLLRIIDVNAHSLSLERTGESDEKQSTHPEKYTALFAKGSKVEHSCNPNLSWVAEDEKLQYIAARQMKQGDRLSISYQTAMCEQPRRARQNKDFTCKCDRCQGPDECNPYVVSCPTCNNIAAVAFLYGANNEFRCIVCQSILPLASMQAQKEWEKSFEQHLNRMQHGLDGGSIVDEGPRALARILKLHNAMAEKLHPLHWLYQKCYRLIGSIAASFGRFQMQTCDGQSSTDSMAAGFLYLSTTALLFQARWIQQVASVLGGTCTLQDCATQIISAPKMPRLPSLQGIQDLVDKLCEKHLATYPLDMAHSVFYAGQDWLLCGDPAKVARLYRYFSPLFKRWIRLSDDNREKMILLIESEGKENQFGNHLLL